MDPLTQIVELLRPQGAYWKIVEARGDWTIRFAPANVVVFGQMLEGAARVERADGVQLDLSRGDFLLMVDPPDWKMAAGAGGKPVDFKTVLAAPDKLTSDAPDGAVSRFVTGNFAISQECSDLLGLLMLPVVLKRPGNVANSRLGALLATLGDEAAGNRPARGFVVARLLDLILVEAFRDHDPAACGAPSRGLLAGLGDPRLGRALRLMHEDSRRAWTVAGLAREVGMSRSAFALRFSQVIGTSPIDYIGKWRLMLAKDALAASDLPMAEIAEMVGFRSVSAFSTSFKRGTGAAPSDYRRGARR